MTDDELKAHAKAVQAALPKNGDLSPTLALSILLEEALKARRELARYQQREQQLQAKERCLKEAALQLLDAINRLNALDVIEAAGLEVVQAPGNLEGIGQSPAPKSPPSLRVVPREPDGGAA